MWRISTEGQALARLIQGYRYAPRSYGTTGIGGPLPHPLASSLPHPRFLSLIHI